MIKKTISRYCLFKTNTEMSSLAFCSLGQRLLGLKGLGQSLDVKRLDFSRSLKLLAQEKSMWIEQFLYLNFLILCTVSGQ